MKIDDLFTKPEDRIQEILEYLKENNIDTGFLSQNDLSKVYKYTIFKLNENRNSSRFGKVINNTFRKYNLIKEIIQLLENTNFRVDSKTGALLNIKDLSDPSNDRDNRPDLYWREQGVLTTDAVVEPYPLSDEEWEDIQSRNPDHLVKDAGIPNDGPASVQDSSGIEADLYVGAGQDSYTTSTAVTRIDPYAKPMIASDPYGIQLPTKVNSEKPTNMISTDELLQNTPDQDAGMDYGQEINSYDSDLEGAKLEKIIKVYSPKGQEIQENEMGTHRFVKLFESEMEKAEIVLATKNIANTIQDMMEKLSKLKIEELNPLIDKVRAQHGIEEANQLHSTISGQIDQAIDVLTTVNSSIDTEALKISGDLPSDVSLDMNTSSTEKQPTDISGQEDTLDLGNEETPAEESIPVQRELKEGRITLTVKMKSGKFEKKFFDTINETHIWISKNRKFIKEIKGMTELKKVAKKDKK